jgi:Pyruvate/2-oxoacid:ferredoxin oxidoreductase delta subunit
MKTIIYWFSGTGNSLAAAKALAEQCGDAELVPMAKALENPPPAVERIGLVFPVYSFGPPAVVARFVEKFNASPDSYIFAVITYASIPGVTLPVLRRMLQKRGLHLAAGRGVKMPENFPPFGGAPSPEKQQQINKSAAEHLRKIAAEIQLSPRGRYDSSMILWRLLGKAAYPFFRRVVKYGDRFFKTDDQCNGCGICAKVCPAADIEMIDGKPKWLGRCEQCYACFHWCPQKAIQCGRSAKQHRYHHPAVSLADFIR